MISRMQGQGVEAHLCLPPQVSRLGLATGAVQETLVILAVLF